MTAELDAAVQAATEAAARTLETDAERLGLDRLTEVKHLKPAFRAALRAAGLTDVQDSEIRLALATWNPRPGGIDVVVGSAPHHSAFFELKWARGKHELGWTLWDLYKLAAARVEHGVPGYAIVGAPTAYWRDEAVDCSALYCDASWDSRELFQRYERAWADLLTGGSARPLRVPASLETQLVAVSTLAMRPRWELRALRLNARDDAWLEFDGDWPVHP